MLIYNEYKFNQIKMKKFLKKASIMLCLTSILMGIFVFAPAGIASALNTPISEVPSAIIQQTGGEGEEGGEDGLRKKSVMSQISSPVSTTFGMVTAVISKFLKFLLLLLMIIMVPTIPILLYCLVAYFVIKKFLSMFTRLK